MKSAQVWAWLVNEILDYGVRWVVVAILLLVVGSFFNWRYTKMNSRVTALEKAVSEARSTTVIHNHMPIVSDPPDIGDVKEIKTMTQAEYDALPTPNEKTLYLIVNQKND